MEIQIIPDNASEEILQLYVNTFQAAPWNESWTIENAHMRINDYLKNPMAIGYDAKIDGKSVGFAMGYTTSYLGRKEFYIEDFIIAPDFQGKGHGTELLSFIQQNVEAKGCRSMILLTRKGLSSEAFYQINGFITNPDVIFMHKGI